MTGADIIIKELIKNFEIIIITARNDKEVEIAREKLNKLGLSDIKIFNNEYSKIQRLLDEDCDYIIDDDENICRKAKEQGVKSIYFKNAAASPVEESENFKVVNNWGEIYKYIMLENRK